MPRDAYRNYGAAIPVGGNQKALWRHVWDENEQQKLQSHEVLDYQEIIRVDARVPRTTIRYSCSCRSGCYCGFKSLGKAASEMKKDTARLIYLRGGFATDD